MKRFKYLGQLPITLVNSSYLCEITKFYQYYYAVINCAFIRNGVEVPPCI